MESWSDEEVARRWWRVCPERKNSDGSAAEPLPCEINLMKMKAEEYRRRFSSISWMMRLASQRIARRANREDDVDGKFFAKPFECRRIESTDDLCSCSFYVDLNVIAAGMADTPEKSKYTSVFDRILARWHDTQTEIDGRVALPTAEEADAWLAPVFLDERADAYPVASAEETPATSSGASTARAAV